MHSLEISSMCVATLHNTLKHALLEAAKRRQDAAEKGWDGPAEAADSTIWYLNQIMTQLDPLYNKLFVR